MQALAKPAGLLSVEEYIDGERMSDVRHEYVDGRVYAMAGASDDHNRIVLNLSSELRVALRGKPCEPFATDMKVRTPPTFAGVFYYPDVMVVCDPTDNARYFRERPSVVFEVISPDTERTDRREKAIAYRQIATIAAYVLIEQDRMAVTVLRRAETGWQSEIVEGSGAVLKLPDLGMAIPLERLYERTGAAGVPRPAV